MSAAGPSTWARTIMTAAVSMLLLVIGSATASADPEDGPTSISISATVADDFQVAASGTLSDSNGDPVPDATVQGQVNGEPVTDATTDDAGVYRLGFALPDSARNGELQLVASFAGQGQLEASEAAITIAAGQASPPTEASAEKTPEDTRLDVFLDVSIAPSTVTAGGLVTIEGTITDSNRTPIPGALISILIDGEESKDSRTISGDSGTFQAFAEIAASRPTGEGSLVVSFAGDTAFTPGLKTFDITIDESPADGATPTATATESAEASALASTEGIDPTAATSDEDSTADEADLQGHLSWFYVALVVVGGTAALVAAALAFRGTYGRRGSSASDERGLDLLLDPEPGDDDPESAGLGDLFSEDDGTQPGDSEETQEFPSPRRGLD